MEGEILAQRGRRRRVDLPPGTRVEGERARIFDVKQYRTLPAHFLLSLLTFFVVWAIAPLRSGRGLLWYSTLMFCWLGVSYVSFVGYSTLLPGAVAIVIVLPGCFVLTWCIRYIATQRMLQRVEAAIGLGTETQLLS